MHGHSILWWILWFPHGWETHFCQCLSMHLRSILNLTKMKQQIRRSCTNQREIQEPCPVHLLLKRRCYFVLCQAMFIIWSGGSQSVLRIIWIFSTCLWKWAMMSAHKPAQIPRFGKSLCGSNNTQSGWDRPESHSSKSYSNNWEVLGIQWAEAVLCMDCPTWAKQSPTHIAITHWTQWLWSQSEWSPLAHWSGPNENPQWRDEPTKHHDVDDIPVQTLSGGPYDAGFRAWRRRAVRWRGQTIMIRAV